MIRTRDFLLFALTLVFLLAGISSTVLLDSWRTNNANTATVIFTEGEVPLGAEAIIDTIDFDDNAARLKARVLAGSGDIEAGDPVFTSVDQILASNVGDSTVSNRTILWCGNRHNDSSLLASWPNEVSIRTAEGARLFLVDEQARLQLPTNPGLLDSPSCVSGVVIGITTGGTLIRNDEVFRYIAMSDKQLIGWALDGFPIYGTRSDSSGLDKCGGELSTTGYRYYIRANEDFVIGCYVGHPMSVSNN